MKEHAQTPPGPVFIAWSGKKQVGKDSATGFAKDILEEHGKRVGVTAFAESLKDIAINVLGIPSNLVYGSNDDKETETLIVWDHFPLDVRLKYSNETFEGKSMPRLGSMTIREVLQVMGTDIFREMFEGDIWANAPFRRDWSDYDVVFITDCRFPNEKRVTEEHDGIVIRLERDTGYVDNHPSETALDDAEFEILFSQSKETTLDDLREFVDDTMRKLNLI
jgi:predicted nucleotidyltransferase